MSVVMAQSLPPCTNFTPIYQMQNVTSNCNISEISAEQANNSYIAYCSFNSKAACSECFRFKQVPCEIVNCIYEKIAEVSGQKFTTNCIHQGLKKYVTELYIPQWLNPDLCPNDNNKILPGICGCGIADTDTDNDGIPDCNDQCINDPNKIAPGICGCGVANTDTDNDGTPDCNDQCNNDPNKTAPGICGCGVADTDTDNDGTPDCNDQCINYPNKIAPGVCGCGVSDIDTDNDGTPDCNDQCITDPNKVAPGVCGCGVVDQDLDGNGTIDCVDACPLDPNKIAVGLCGCGVADTDTDNDGTPDCDEECDNDPNKIGPGICGCGVADTDTDNDEIPDCTDECDNDPDKTVPGLCGCGIADTDTDNDGTPDCNDQCDNNPNKIVSGVCGCGVADTDTDNDGTPNCNDQCNNDPNKTAPGVCGCGVADLDTDNDGTPDCNDQCKTDPNKTTPGACGCGKAESSIDSDGDGIFDCNEICTDSICASADPTKPYCDYATDTCVECRNQGHCSGNTINKQCNFTTKQCVECLSDNTGCTNPKAICELSNNTCVECLQSSQCVYALDKKVCDKNSNTCIECEVNQDCALGEYCDLNSCAKHADCAGNNSNCPTAMPICITSVTPNVCVECTSTNTSRCTAGQYCLNNRCWDSTTAFRGVLSTDGNYRLKVNDNVLNDGSATQAIGCYAKNANNKIICVVFNQGDCHRRTFGSNGNSETYWIKDTTCGYNNSTAALAIYNDLDPKTIAGSPPNKPGLFTAYYNSSNLRYELKINNNNIVEGYATKGMGCGVFDANNPNIVDCIAFNESDCYKRQYNLNGYAIPTSNWVQDTNCGYGRVEEALLLISKLNLTFEGVPLTTGASFVISDAAYMIRQLRINGLFIRNATYAMGCRYDDNDSNLVHCTGFNRLYCERQSFSIFGDKVNNDWIRDEECGFGDDIEQAQIEYNYYKGNPKLISLLGLDPTVLKTINASDAGSYYGHIVQAQNSSGVPAGDTFLNYPPQFGLASGCKENATDPEILDCVIFGQTQCIKLQFNKYGFFYDGVATFDDTCGYEASDLAEATALYNSLTEVSGPSPSAYTQVAPQFSARVRLYSGTTDVNVYYVSINGGLAPRDGIKAAGCKAELNGKRLCYVFNLLDCYSAEYDIATGAIVSAYTRDTSCGYNNYQAALDLFNSLDPAVRIGDPPSDGSVTFKAYLQPNNTIQLKVGDSLDSGKVATESMGCLPEAPVTRNRVCYAFNENECHKREYLNTGFAVTPWQTETDCGYRHYTKTRLLYNALDPATIYVKNPFSKKTFIAEQQGDKYYIKIDNQLQTQVFGSRAAGCYPVKPEANCEPYPGSWDQQTCDQITCVVFGTDDCSRRKFTVTGYPIDNNWIIDTNCGYFDYTIAKTDVYDEYNKLDSLTRLGAAPSLDAEFKGKQDGTKYYMQINTTTDTTIVTNGTHLIDFAVGCSYPDVNDQRECYAFYYDKCYKRKYTRYGVAIDTNWRTEDLTCGYSNYTQANNIITNIIDPTTYAGVPLSNTPVSFSGYLNTSNNKYYLSIGGNVWTDFYITQGMGCRPVVGGQRQCIAFGNLACYRRTYTNTGYPIDLGWNSIPNCGFNTGNSVDRDNAIVEYLQLETSTYVGNIP